MLHLLLLSVELLTQQSQLCTIELLPVRRVSLESAHAFIEHPPLLRLAVLLVSGLCLDELFSLLPTLLSSPFSLPAETQRCMLLLLLQHCQRSQRKVSFCFVMLITES